VFTLSATKLLLQKELPGALPTPLANACRGMAHQVLDLLQIATDDDLADHDNGMPHPPPAPRAMPGSAVPA